MSVNELLPSLLQTRFRLWSFMTDKVILACFAVILLQLIVDPVQVPDSLVFLGDALVSMAPFFLIAVALAAYFQASGADGYIAKAFSGSPVTAIFAAALVGALSPFCSCGVIPLVASLLVAGVPLAPVMAFWIASPIMDPEIFVLTSVGIGVGFASGKTVIAIALGIFAGSTIFLLQKRGAIQNPLRADMPGGCRPKLDLNGPVQVHWQIWSDQDRRAVFKESGLANGWLIGRWLVLAFLLEAIMVTYIPTTFVEDLVGQENLFAIPLAVLIGIPSYLNGYAAIPLVSGLLELGMSQGAAMAFMTAGAVSSIPAAVAVFGLVKREIFAIYLLLGFVGSILTGLLWQYMSQILYQFL